MDKYKGHRRVIKVVEEYVIRQVELLQRAFLMFIARWLHIVTVDTANKLRMNAKPFCHSRKRESQRDIRTYIKRR